MMIVGTVILAILIGVYAFLRFMDGLRDLKDEEDWGDWT
jgi:hypothetical protein